MLTPLLESFVRTSPSVVPTVLLGVAAASMLLRRPLPAMGTEMSVHEALHTLVLDTFLTSDERRVLKGDEIDAAAHLRADDTVGILRGTLDLTCAAVRKNRQVWCLSCPGQWASVCGFFAVVEVRL
jgi:hypothetical protein